MSTRPFRIMNVVGTRPNMMKIAPLMAAMKASDLLDPVLVHTGQHYDYALSQVFFEQLGMPAPDFNLEVGSGSHHQQTAAVMERFGELVQKHRPHLIVVPGDVNSTMACALVAAKEMIPVAHVEAGLRSFDRSMPEEVNRVVTDSVSDLLFTTEESARENLIREGSIPEKIHFVGNTMIDSLTEAIDRARSSALKRDLGLSPKSYAVLTLHRPANVDDVQRLVATLQAIAELGREIPVIFPVHPRTRAKIAASGFTEIRDWQPGMQASGVMMIPPASYLDFIGLVDEAALVITDSGGLQEETTYLGVECLTFRENTERPVTVNLGTNRLIGTNPDRLVGEARIALENSSGRAAGHTAPPLWDGHAASRIVAILENYLSESVRDLSLVTA